MRAAALPLLLLLGLSLSSISAFAYSSEYVSSSVAAQRELLGDVAAAAADPVAVLLANGTSNDTSPSTTGTSSSNVTQTQNVTTPADTPISPPPPPNNAYRIDCEVLSNTNEFPAGNIYMTALVRTMARMQADTTGRCGYRQLASIHGSSRMYDGVSSSRAGFCPHGSQNFVPWHRYYTCHMEACMLEKCLQEAELFTNQTVKADLTNRVCHLLRMPFWQWTINSTACRLATASTWPVLDNDGVTIRNMANPWARYGTSRRASNSMAHSCRRTMGTFIASRNRNCLYTGAASRCTANLEACHNNAHSAVGGTMGSVATASNDPIFFLHHCFIDLMGRQWQNNGGQMYTPGALRPFGQAYTDTIQPMCGTRGVVYWLGRTNPYKTSDGYNIPGGTVASAQGTGPAAAAAEPALVNGSVPLPSAAAARMQLDTVMQSLVGDYTGYTWHLALPEVHCKQTRTAWTILAVMKGTRLPRSRGRAVDMKALAELPGYCDQWYAFSCVDPMVNAPYVDVTFDLTQCLANTGRQPDVAPKDPSHPLLGPASVPVSLKDVQLVVLDANKRPMRNFKLPKRTTLSWAYVYNTNTLVKDTTTSQAAVAAAAAAAGSGGWGLVGGVVESVGSSNSTAAALSP